MVWVCGNACPVAVPIWYRVWFISCWTIPIARWHFCPQALTCRSTSMPGNKITCCHAYPIIIGSQLFPVHFYQLYFHLPTVRNCYDPHVHKVPSALNPMLCSAPAAMLTNGGTGADLRGWWSIWTVPSPSCLKLLCPRPRGTICFQTNLWSCPATALVHFVSAPICVCTGTSW